MIVPSQGYLHARQSQDAVSLSSLTTSHSSILSPSQQTTPPEQRELPQVPKQEDPDAMMGLEYSTGPIVFGDWESFTSGMIDDTPNHHAPTEWNTVPYYADGSKVSS